jgi:hypothetical protein
MYSIPKAFEMLGERFTGIDAGHVGQCKPPQLRVFDKNGLLKCCNAIIVKLHHVVVRQWIAGLIIDFKTGVEFEHVQQLKQK